MTRSKEREAPLRSATLERWWPTTQRLPLIEAPIEAAAEAMTALQMEWFKGRVRLEWEQVPDLNAAFETAGGLGSLDSVGILLPTRSKWTVVWHNGSLLSDPPIASNMTRRSGFPSIEWVSSDTLTNTQPGTTFKHMRLVDGEMVSRRVQASQNDGSWYFDQRGDPLPEEDLEGYGVRRKRDRLNERRMSELLERLGARPWREDFYALPEQPIFVCRRTELPSQFQLFEPDEILKKYRLEAVEWARRNQKRPRNTSLERIRARIELGGDLSDPDTPTVLLTLSEFFDGNEVYGSIGCNLSPPPSPAEFRTLLEGIAQKKVVSDVRVEIASLEGGDWPFADTVWILARATAEEIRAWFPTHLAPDEIEGGWKRGVRYEACDVPSGHTAFSCFWD